MSCYDAFIYFSCVYSSSFSPLICISLISSQSLWSLFLSSILSSIYSTHDSCSFTEREQSTRQGKRLNLHDIASGFGSFWGQRNRDSVLYSEYALQLQSLFLQYKTDRFSHEKALHRKLPYIICSVGDYVTAAVTKINYSLSSEHQRAPINVIFFQGHI